MNFIKIVFTLVATLYSTQNLHSAEKNNTTDHSDKSTTNKPTRSGVTIHRNPIEKLESYDDDFEEEKTDTKKNVTHARKIQPKYGKSKSAEDLAAAALTADSRVTRYSAKRNHKEAK